MILFLLFQHTQIVSIIFLTYFRILKHAKESKLLSTVLAGLAKWSTALYSFHMIHLCDFYRFAHFINVDFFGDLFRVLRELVLSGVSCNLFHANSLVSRIAEENCIQQTYISKQFYAVQCHFMHYTAVHCALLLGLGNWIQYRLGFSMFARTRYCCHPSCVVIALNLCAFSF
jgi:hypothetical protein